MHAGVLDLLDRHRATWADHTPTEDAIEALRAALDRVKTLDGERRRLGTVGVTADKDEQRDAMEAATMRLVQAVRPYARVIGDRALEAEVDVAPSDLSRTSDANAVGWADRVAAAALTHLGALATYKVTQADVTALTDARAAFAPLRAARDATDTQREARTKALREPFKAGRKATTLLDDLVPGLGDDGLTDEYRQARRTDDRR